MESYEKRTWWSRHDMTERLKNETFLEAAITSGFLVAAADGSASELEYDALLDRLEILGGVDRDKIDEVLTAVSNDVEANGFDPRLRRLGELVANKDAAQAALMLGLAIALADEEFTAQEREIVGKIVTALKLTGVDIDATVNELRGS
jgi:tellurite resistance protein